MQNTGYFFHFIDGYGDECKWALVDSPVYRSSNHYKGDTYHGGLEPAYIGIMQPNGQTGYLPIIHLERLRPDIDKGSLFIATDCYTLPESFKEYNYQAWLDSQLYIVVTRGNTSITIQDANGINYYYNTTYGIS